MIPCTTRRKGVAGPDFLTSCRNFFFSSFRTPSPFPYMVYLDHVYIFFADATITGPTFRHKLVIHTRSMVLSGVGGDCWRVIDKRAEGVMVRKK